MSLGAPKQAPVTLEGQRLGGHCGWGVREAGIALEFKLVAEALNGVWLLGTQYKGLATSIQTGLRCY